MTAASRRATAADPPVTKGRLQATGPAPAPGANR